MERKVHRVVLMVVDHDDLGQEEVISVLENNRYPNHCMSPAVMTIDTETVEWDDAHPLNHSNLQDEAFRKLFVRSK